MMKSILDRFAELKADPTFKPNLIQAFGKLAFIDVNENLKGEDFATMLASIAVSTEQIELSGAQVETTESQGGRVHHATINDSVKLADGLGG